MRELWAIGLNTFREAIRNRVFFSLIFFAVVMMFVTMAAGSGSLHEEVRLVKDLGLFLASTFSVIIAIFVGATLVYKEIERKTIFTIVPKPIFRWQFLLGKYLGLAATMAVQIGVMALVLWLQFIALDEPFSLGMWQAMWMAYIEVLVVMAIALFFSSFSTPFLTGILSIGCFVVGRFTDRLIDLSFKPKAGAPPNDSLETLATVIRGIAHVLPDLSVFNATPYVVYDTPIGWDLVAHSTLSGLSYAAIVLVLAAVLFSRRDFV